MALTTGPFPYDITNLLGGAVRILKAPIDEAVPDGIEDIIAMVHPYAAIADWVDMGATRDAFSYGRSFDSEGYEIQQVRGNVIEELTDITRTIEVSIADFRPEHLQLVENASAVATVNSPAAANTSIQKKVAFGSFSSVDQYRFAFIAMRPKQAGIVTEPGGRERGRFFAGVAYAAQLSADEVTMEFDKGALTATGVTFALFPESTEDSGEEYGAWFDEQAGTISA